jgi:hypothetical protein
MGLFDQFPLVDTPSNCYHFPMTDSFPPRPGSAMYSDSLDFDFEEIVNIWPSPTSSRSVRKTLRHERDHSWRRPEIKSDGHVNFPSQVLPLRQRGVSPTCRCACVWQPPRRPAGRHHAVPGPADVRADGDRLLLG